MEDYFNVGLRITREDVVDALQGLDPGAVEDVNNISDEDMQLIADRTGESMLESLYDHIDGPAYSVLNPEVKSSLSMRSIKKAGYKPGDEVARACPQCSEPMSYHYDGKKSWLECMNGHTEQLVAENKEGEGLAGQTNMSMEPEEGEKKAARLSTRGKK